MLKVQHIAKETSAFVVLHYRYMFCSAKTAFFPGWSNYVRQAFHLLLPHWLNGCNQSWKKQYSFHLQYIYVLCSAALRSRRFFFSFSIEIVMKIKKKTATRLDPWEILWRYRCSPASPIKGFGTKRARLGTFKEISKNCRFFPEKEKKPAQNMKFWLKN